MLVNLTIWPQDHGRILAIIAPCGSAFGLGAKQKDRIGDVCVHTRVAWILVGGWPGHRPEEVAEIQAEDLRLEGFEVEIFRNLDCLTNADRLKAVDLIVPNWTMGDISPDALRPWLDAVRAGTGVAGLHGGMGDAFRKDTAYQLMVGGQWVDHPGGDGVTYNVHIVDSGDPLTQGMQDFSVTTEQYYMHVDPANRVLATTQFGSVSMPVVWTKTFGQGRIFYCALGHSPDIVERAEVRQLMRRGMVYAARTVEEAAP